MQMPRCNDTVDGEEMGRRWGCGLTHHPVHDRVFAKEDHFTGCGSDKVANLRLGSPREG